MMNFGSQVAVWCARPDHSEKELAEIVGVSRPFISDVAAGKKHPSVDVIRKIAAVMGMPFDEALVRAAKHDKKTDTYRVNVTREMLLELQRIYCGLK